MFEVATLSGNRIESACALKAKTKTIMGQIIGTSSSGKGDKSKSLYKRQLSVQPMQRKASKRGSVRHNESARDSILRVKNETNKALNNGQIKPLPDRPVTINAFNLVDKDNVINGDNFKNNSIDSNSSTQQVKQQKPFSSKEFFKSGESYHKTDVCYYKTIDGGYHKLPHDSYHKMTENCYVKIQDGSFRRFDDINNAINGTTEDPVQLRVKSHVKRFLNRSKSHTPATIKEMQRQQQLKEVDNENLLIEENSNIIIKSHNTSGNHSTHQQATSNTTQLQNRRVMVTMIEGGMPVVATSKASASNKTKAKNKNNTNKVKKWF